MAIGATALVALVTLTALLGAGWRPLRRLDRDVLHGLNHATAPHPDAVHFWKVVSDLGQPVTFQTLAVLTALLLWRSGRVPLAVFTAATVLGAGLLSIAGKALLGRARPQPADPIAHAGGASFPSGHALSSSVAVAVFLVLVLPHLRGGRRVAAVVGGALLTGLIAFSRLALGVHYLSDVAGGWLLAVVWVVLTLTVLARFTARPRPARGRPSADPPP